MHHPGTAGDSSSANLHQSQGRNSTADSGQHGSQHSSQRTGGWGGLKSYYRYIMAPAQEDELAALQDADVQKVQEAAGAALAEANERLLEAELRVQAAQVSLTY
jgi:hypothetical protein